MLCGFSNLLFLLVFFAMMDETLILLFRLQGAINGAVRFKAAFGDFSFLTSLCYGTFLGALTNVGAIRVLTLPYIGQKLTEGRQKLIKLVEIEASKVDKREAGSIRKEAGIWAVLNIKNLHVAGSMAAALDLA